MKLLLLALAVIACLAGCGTGPLVESGSYHVSQESYAYDVALVRPRAAFAFSCPVDEVRMVVVGVSPVLTSEPTQIGVSGCGHRGIFVREDGEWVLTGTVTERATEAVVSPVH